MSNRILTAMLATGLLTLVAGDRPATAQEGHQAAIDFRTATMTVFKWHMGPMVAMAKGKIPFDPATFADNAQGLATAARLNLLAGFPEDSLDVDSEAKAEIWQRWPEFTEKFKELRSESARLAEVSAGGDAEASLAQFKKTASTCGSCHDEFKEKN